MFSKISTRFLRVRSKIARMKIVHKMTEAETLIDIHTDKNAKFRFHIHGQDDRIIATSNAYTDLARLKHDLDVLLHGRVSISERI